MGVFDKDFATGLDDAEKAFKGGKFYVGDRGPFDAISIDKIQLADRQALGGRYQNANTTIYLRPNVLRAAGLKDGVELRVDPEDPQTAPDYFRVIGLESDGDDAVTVICGPADFDIRMR